MRTCRILMLFFVIVGLLGVTLSVTHLHLLEAPPASLFIYTISAALGLFGVIQTIRKA